MLKMSKLFLKITGVNLTSPKFYKKGIKWMDLGLNDKMKQKILYII